MTWLLISFTNYHPKYEEAKIMGPIRIKKFVKHDPED